MSILLKNGYLLTLDSADRVIERGDVLIRGSVIEAVGPDLAVDHSSVERVIDAKGKLVAPGFVNAHMHTGEGLTRGLVSGLPNELWNLWTYPPLGANPIGARLLYLRTLLDAIEMIKSGVTTVQDHSREWFLSPESNAEDAYFAAYAEAGLRLSLAINIINRPWHEIFPDLPRLLPPEVVEAMVGASSHWHIDPVDDIVRLCERTVSRWHGYQGRFSVALGPSAPQRCTEELLGRLGDLARADHLAIHTHLLETHIQADLSRRHPAGSYVRYLQALGLLGPRTTVAHAIWVSDADIQILGEADCCVVHNPVCNLYLGSGIMPFARLAEAGVRLALGLDGTSSAGRLSMFEVMKTAALLHTTDPDYGRWPTAQQILRMATQGGAYSIGHEGRLGALAPGQLADVILLDLHSPAFTPLHHPSNQMVYSETGRSVETVIIHGKLVMEDRRLLTFDEAAVLAELRALWPEHQARHHHTVEVSQRLFPALRHVHRAAAGLEPAS